MPTEKTYRMELTRRQLSILKEQMTAVADPGHRDADELALLELIEQTHTRAYNAERLRTARALVHAAEVPALKAAPGFYERFIDDPN